MVSIVINAGGSATGQGTTAEDVWDINGTLGS